ncbi:putative N,N-dimethylaniline monooxygenase COQ6 PWA37_004775 [Arxiozyma heterogenica]|uniref:putative N,N-dimethylaniline monooxygenase COQ6 n=1 Tax=Arxiozyma heterogenica TaxID=278026 RepID=UPI002F253F89
MFSRGFIRKLATSTKSTPKITDILIVGGGPAGLTLATGIQESPILSKYNVTLVDGNDLLNKVGDFYYDPPSYFTNRVVSVTPQSMKFLTEKLKVALLQDRIQPYDGLYVNDGITDAFLEIEREEMLYMIEILNIQSSLLHKLTTNSINSRVNIFDNCKVKSITSSVKGDPTSWPLVELANGEIYKTRLLVGADGFNSPVRNFAGLYSRGWKYDTWGLVATLKLDPQSLPIYKLRGWQRFLPTGPLAHLPLPGDNASMVWSTGGNEMSSILMEMDSKLFAKMVNAGFILTTTDIQYYLAAFKKGTLTTEQIIEDIDDRINQVYSSFKDETQIDEKFPPLVVDVVPGTRARFPLKFSHADSYVTDRVALVGDAAHTTHPLVGQGLNMGQHDIEQLLNCLERATLRGQDIGSALSLEPYWANSYGFNNIRLGMADKLHKLYHTDFTPVVAMRSLGLNIVNQLNPVKNLIADIMTGR